MTHSHVDAFLKKFDDFDSCIEIVSSQCKVRMKLNKGGDIEFEHEEDDENLKQTVGNMLVCYPCGPGAGTPTKNVFLKNISKLLDEKIKANEGMLLLPDHLQKINDLEPHAELRQICPLTLLVPTS